MLRASAAPTDHQPNLPLITIKALRDLTPSIGRNAYKEIRASLS